MLKRPTNPTITVTRPIPSTPVLLGSHTLDEVPFKSPGECIQSFSGTIRSAIINGGLECNQAAGSSGYNEMMNRVTYDKNFCSTLGVDPGTDLTC